MAKDEFASAMTEGSVGLPSPDLQVCHWIRWDWIRVDQIGLADTFKQSRDLNSSTKPEHEEGDKSPVQGVEALLGPGQVKC